MRAGVYSGLVRRPAATPVMTHVGAASLGGNVTSVISADPLRYIAGSLFPAALGYLFAGAKGAAIGGVLGAGIMLWTASVVAAHDALLSPGGSA